MRSVIWLVLLFVVAVVAALTLGDNDGLVSFYWGSWRLDVSVNFFVLALFGLGFVLLSALQAVNVLLGLPTQAREWRTRRLDRVAQSALREAVAEFFAGRYGRAQKAAQRAIAVRRDGDQAGDDNDFLVLAYLLAAGSLHRLQDRGRRDEMLRRALRMGRRAGTPAFDGARLLAAEWALDDGDAGRVEQLLGELPPGTARRTQALRLKLRADRLARRPIEALHTARLLANHQAFSAAAAQGLLRSLAFEVLDSAHDADQLRRGWQQLDPADQRDPFVVARAARRAGQVQIPDEGRNWLRPLWDRLDSVGVDGRQELALALPAVVTGLDVDWLPRLEAALRAYPNEPAVQGAVGAAFIERQLWGKARRPLEAAAMAAGLEPRARRSAWRALALLAREEGDESRACACDRAAAAID